MLGELARKLGKERGLLFRVYFAPNASTQPAHSRRAHRRLRPTPDQLTESRGHLVVMLRHLDPAEQAAIAALVQQILAAKADGPAAPKSAVAGAVASPAEA